MSLAECPVRLTGFGECAGSGNETKQNSDLLSNHGATDTAAQTAASSADAGSYYVIKATRCNIFAVQTDPPVPPSLARGLATACCQRYLSFLALGGRDTESIPFRMNRIAPTNGASFR